VGQWNSDGLTNYYYLTPRVRATSFSLVRTFRCLDLWNGLGLIMNVEQAETEGGSWLSRNSRLLSFEYHEKEKKKETRRLILVVE
jgi:hypothetical protein